MGTRRIFRSIVPLVLALMVLATLGACQAIFTYTPLVVFQRSPDTMTPAEKITYAQDALASGDKATMTAAYNAIKDDTSTTGSYTAAQLAVEISGVPDLIVKAISDPASISGGATDVSTFLANNPDVQPQYLVAAADKLVGLPAADLAPMDYVYGGLGLMLGVATDPATGVIDMARITDPANATAVNDAKNFIQSGINTSTTSTSDPLYALLSFVQGL